MIKNASKELMPYSGGMRKEYGIKAKELGYEVKWSGGLSFYKNGLYLDTYYPKESFYMEDVIEAINIKIKKKKLVKRKSEEEARAELHSRIAAGEPLFLKNKPKNKRSDNMMIMALAMSYLNMSKLAVVPCGSKSSWSPRDAFRS